MYSTRKHSGREKNSDQEWEKKGLTLNLAVRGSPVPLYAQKPRTFREYKICKHVPKEPKRKEFSFPVDKIIYLTERLELTSLTEKKIKSVSLSEVNIKAKNSLGKVENEVVWSRGYEGKHDKLSNEVSSGFDLSLDLSSVANTGDDSDESCSESEETFFYHNCESPTASPSEKEPCETSRVANCSNRSSLEYDGNGACAIYDECERTKINKCDLINVYLNSVNNQKELVRFLRPCRTCKEPCCICSDSSYQSDPSSGINSVSHIFESTRDSSCSFNVVDKKDKTSVSNAQFPCECMDCPMLRKKLCCNDFCRREIFGSNFYTSFCERERDAVFQSGSDDFVDSNRIHAYTSSLANAAKSARILARDLECILSTLNNEAG